MKTSRLVTSFEDGLLATVEELLDEGSKDQTALEGWQRDHGDEMDKLAGNQNVRNTERGTFAKETERFDKERVVETDKEKPSPAVANVQGCATMLGLAPTQEEVNEWFSNLVLSACELRGQRLRELTEAHLILAQVDPTDPDSPRYRGQGLG